MSPPVQGDNDTSTPRKWESSIEPSAPSPGIRTDTLLWLVLLDPATVFLTNQENFTVVTSYYNFTSRFSRDWGLTSAAAMMMIAPIIVIFLSLQRRFVDGLTQGGIKG